ncbi:MAG: transposase [Thermomicrobiales bacterium]
MTEGAGIPIAVLLTGANRHDMKKLAALLDATVIAPAPAEEAHVVLDRGYDHPSCRAAVIARGYTPHIPPESKRSHAIATAG